MDDVTKILSAMEQGEPEASERLLPLVYAELRNLAASKLAKEKPGQTLQPTALVHEAYLRLVDREKIQRWDSRGHFFAAAAEAIRRILIEKARQKMGPKAGGNRHRLTLSSINAETQEADWDLIDLNDALEQLEVEDARAASLVKLRFFAGLNRRQAAEALGVSVATADNDWAYAKGWLQSRLSSEAKSRH